MAKPKILYAVRSEFDAWEGDGIIAVFDTRDKAQLYADLQTEADTCGNTITVEEIPLNPRFKA